MEENENKGEFHIQEYECGQKTNLYRMGNHRDCINLSTIKKKTNTSLSSLVRAFFYPDNYPLGNYLNSKKQEEILLFLFI
jgi:hypothetical protein